MRHYSDGNQGYDTTSLKEIRKQQKIQYTPPTMKGLNNMWMAKNKINNIEQKPVIPV